MSSKQGPPSALPGVPALRPQSRGRLAEEGSGIIGLFFGLGLTVLFFGAGLDEPSGSGRILAPIAFGALVSLPGLLATLARWRPTLYLAAATLGFPLMFVSMAGAGFPLLIPAALSLVAYGRRAGDSIPRVTAPLIGMLAFALGIASFLVMIVHEDPRCSGIENGVTCSSDVVTAPEALASLAISVMAVIVLWTLARPRRDA